MGGGGEGGERERKEMGKGKEWGGGSVEGGTGMGEEKGGEGVVKGREGWRRWIGGGGR